MQKIKITGDTKSEKKERAILVDKVEPQGDF